MIDRLLPGDYEALKVGAVDNKHAGDSTLRLVGLGLMSSRVDGTTGEERGALSIADPNKVKHDITSFGRTLLDITK